MRKRTVKYRLEVNYYSRSYDDRACEISSPIYTKKDGLTEYKKAIQAHCIDDDSKPARVHFWKYNWNGNKPEHITIAKNY